MRIFFQKKKRKKFNQDGQNVKQIHILARVIYTTSIETNPFFFTSTTSRRVARTRRFAFKPCTRHFYLTREDVSRQDKRELRM